MHQENTIFGTAWVSDPGDPTDPEQLEMLRTACSQLPTGFCNDASTDDFVGDQGVRRERSTGRYYLPTFDMAGNMDKMYLGEGKPLKKGHIIAHPRPAEPQPHYGGGNPVKSAQAAGAWAFWTFAAPVGLVALIISSAVWMWNYFAPVVFAP